MCIRKQVQSTNARLNRNFLDFSQFPPIQRSERLLTFVQRYGKTS